MKTFLVWKINSETWLQGGCLHMWKILRSVHVEVDLMYFFWQI